MAKIKIKVCVGTNCAFRGGQTLCDMLESDSLLDGKIDIETVNCIDHLCDDGHEAPVVEIDGQVFKRTSIEKISEMVYSRVKEQEEM